MTENLPNVLLITADQLRYDCVGSSGRYPVSTPHLDRLAEQGVAFANAYSHIPVCCPARQSLLNGRRAEAFGGLWNFGNALPVGSLQPGDYAWPRTLSDNGYKSVFLGKWGVHPELDATAFGYDTYVSEAEYGEFVRSRYPDVRFENGFFGETNPIPLVDSGTHWLAARAAEHLERLHAAGEPWHIAVHFKDPHLPCRPSDRFADMYDPQQVPEWDGFRESFAGKPYIQRQQLYNWGVEHYTWDDWAPVVARYYGMISQMDEAVGSVLQALERLGVADNTIVIFTADHGDMCGSHRMMDKHYILYDDVVHVPLFIRWPQEIPAGGQCDRFVYSFLDLPPTLLEMLGLQAFDPGNLQGASLVPLLQAVCGKLDGGDVCKNRSPESDDAACNNRFAEGDATCLEDGEVGSDEASTAWPPWRDAVVASYNGQQFGLYTQRMIRTREWKYVWNHTDTDELYDLTADPAELHNRIADPDKAELLSDLRRRLYERLSADGDGLVVNGAMRRQLLEGAKLNGRD